MEQNERQRDRELERGKEKESTNLYLLMRSGSQILYDDPSNRILTFRRNHRARLVRIWNE